MSGLDPQTLELVVYIIGFFGLVTAYAAMPRDWALWAGIAAYFTVLLAGLAKAKGDGRLAEVMK